MFSVFEWFVLVLWCDAFVFLLFCLMNQGRTKVEGLSTANYLKHPSNLIAGCAKAALLFFCACSCGVLFLWLFSLYINTSRQQVENASVLSCSKTTYWIVQRLFQNIKTC